MGAAKKIASVTSLTTAANTNAKATIKPGFNETAMTRAQTALYRDMRVAERCILSPDDALYGIAVPSVN